MARIRSVKPELCTDERFADCSATARLVFVLMQPFCDDSGIHPAKVRTLKAEVFPMDEGFSSADVEGWIGELISAGLVGEFEAGGERYWFVRDWSTWQKIEKPSRKYPRPDDPGSTAVRRAVVEQSPTDSRTVADPSPADGRMEGRGMDEEGNGGEFATTPSGDGSPAAPKSKASHRKEPGRTSATWEAYSKAYLARYGAEPIRNQTVNGQLAKFVDQLPAEEAPEVAAFYVRHSGAFYVQAMHPVNLLLRDASKLRTEWVTGRGVAGGPRRAMQDFTGVNYMEGLDGGLLTA